MSTLAATNLKNASSGSNNIVLGSDGSTRITTLADSAGANTSTPAAIAAGIAKAWVNFNGNTATPSTIRASYNVSSVTKNGTGDYTVNFTNALVDTNYSCVVTGDDGGSTGQSAFHTSTFNTNSVRIHNNYTVANSGLTFTDTAVASVLVFR